MGRSLTFEDLAEEAGQAAEQASSSGGSSSDESTGEWVMRTVELLDKRGLLEPVLFGPDGAAEVQQQVQNKAEQAAAERTEQGDGDGDGGLDLDAESIAEAGKAVMEQLGDDVTVADLVAICESNPAMVNKQIQEAL